MKYLSRHSFKCFIILMVLSMSFAQTSIVDTFPYLVVTPAKPEALKDTVTLQIMLGTASNSCLAPTYVNCSFVIQQSPLDLYPPIFNVKAQFTEVPLPKDKVCPAVYNPVDYGPVFKLGVLKSGTYQVSDEKTTYGEFSVGEIPLPVSFILKGRVYDDPYPLKIASRPIPNAKIYLMSPPLPLDLTQEAASSQSSTVIFSDSATTDTNGNFTFTQLRKDSYELTCRHKEFRTVKMSMLVRSDTSVTIKMVPNNAYAAVQGRVTLVWSDGGVKPLKGCNIAVSKTNFNPVVPLDDIAAPDDDVIYTKTDVDGKYSIDSIPISANGEIWHVYAYNDRFHDYQKVALYNTKTETVDFKFTEPYQNRDSVDIKGIVFCTATDKYSYRKDEPVKIRYSITNTTDQQVTFGTFSQGCEYDLIITVLPTVATAQKKVIYRQSENLICIDLVSVITVDPHQTVIKDFPNYYLPNLASFAPTNNKIMLMVSAKLSGANYDSTEAGVPIEIRLDPTAVAEKKSVSGGSLMSCDMRDQRIALNLLKAQNVSVAVYSLDGKMLPHSAFSRNLAVGAHTLSLMGAHMTKGVYIVGVKGADFEKKFSLVNVKHAR